MDFTLDDEQEMIVQTVRRFADRDLRGWAPDADRAGAPPDRLRAQAAELGFFVDAVPASHGGSPEGAHSHVTPARRRFALCPGCAALAARAPANRQPRRPPPA